MDIPDGRLSQLEDALLCSKTECLVSTYENSYQMNMKCPFKIKVAELGSPKVTMGTIARPQLWCEYAHV